MGTFVIDQQGFKNHAKSVNKIKRLQRNSSGVNTHRVYLPSATVLLVKGRIYICGKIDEDSMIIQNSIIAIWYYPSFRPSLHPPSIINDFLEQKSRIIKIRMFM